MLGGKNTSKTYVPNQRTIFDLASKLKRYFEIFLNYQETIRIYKLNLYFEKKNHNPCHHLWNHLLPAQFK